jgi:hypothetical protein
MRAELRLGMGCGCAWLRAATGASKTCYGARAGRGVVVLAEARGDLHTIIGILPEGSYSASVTEVGRKVGVCAVGDVLVQDDRVYLELHQPSWVDEA